MIDLREFLSQAVLVITATTLFYVAMTDLREFKIRNDLVLILACLFGIYAFLSGQWVSAHWNLAFAFLMFVVMLVFYTKNWLGGGDIKILTVAFLWVGIRYALPFALMLLVFAVIHIVMAEKFKWVSVRRTEGRARIPFAPSIAAAMIGVFVLRWSGL
jgi:prepilin peptidase CpaA